MPSFENDSPITYDFLYNLLDGTFDDAYSNLMLSSTSPGVTDVYDSGPLALYDYEHAALYWPGGHPQHGREFEIVPLREPEATDESALRAELKNMNLGASVGSAALGRVPPIVKRSWELFERQAAPRPALEVGLEAIKRIGVPFAVCSFTRVARSQVSRVGERAMFLWHPINLRPAPVLEHLQTVVRSTMDQDPNL